MKNYKKIILLTCLMLLVYILPTYAAVKNPFSKDNNPILDKAAKEGGYAQDIDEQTFLATTLGNVVFALFSIIGIVFTALIFYGGYRWMTARGNEDEVSKGKSIIRNAIIGLSVAFASYSFWLLISKYLIGIT